MKLQHLFLLPLILLVSCKEEAPVLKPYEIIKSDTFIDCENKEFNGGEATEILIHSKISNVSIKNCKLKGDIRIFGVGVNGEDPSVKESSQTAGHTERIQERAPSNILISNMTIEGVRKIPLYVSPGVTNVRIENNTFTGYTDSTVIYLDAESANNTIRNNTFSVEATTSLIKTRVREVIAVDGSANNIIADNKFEKAVGGGVYLYRNCGEGGTIRHQTPQHNLIENNTFNLSGLNPDAQGIWLGSRNGNRSYCDADNGYNFGSSIDNRDFADNNTVRNNKFINSETKIRDNGNNNIVE
jgi:hypothetical protein